MAKEPENTGPSNISLDGTEKDDKLSYIIDQLFQQMKPFLPIDSIEKIKKGLNEIELGTHRIPLNIFSPFLSKDIFPIENEENLKNKLSEGVRRGISLISSGDIRVGNQAHIDVFTTTFKFPEDIIMSRVPVRKIFKFSDTASAGSK